VAGSAVQWIVLDIEGTTSATESVHVGLFSYARPRLESWINDHIDDPLVVEAVAQTRNDAGLTSDAPIADVVAALQQWIDADVKATPLKTLQGQIWAAGFARGELTAHVFEDVPAAMRAWHADGFRLAIYSSGSVSSQQPWFKHTAAGDLSILIDDWFDTVSAGPKRETASYRRIADTLGDPDTLLFLSDVPAELDAAREAGWRTAGLRRPGEPYGAADFGTHTTIASFDELEIAPSADSSIALDTASLEQVLAAGDRLAVESARLASMGWMRATSGNLSEVLSRAPLHLAVTASGFDKGDLTRESIAVVDKAGSALEIPGLAPLKPSDESALHSLIVDRTGAGAVVHVHALAAAMAGHRWPMGVPLRRLEMLKALDRRDDEDVLVPVIANSQDMGVLGDRFDAAFDLDVPGVVVADHGLYVWGRDLVQARHRTEALEWLLSFVLACH
jgi:2,3-diketo-5-methylthio-1-phosphopentane phosphatase/methylthioribulose-1-phosphate dehydratase